MDRRSVLGWVIMGIFAGCSTGPTGSTTTPTRTPGVSAALEIGEAEWDPDATPAGVYGTVTNTGQRPFRSVVIRVEYFDSDGATIDNARGRVSDLEPGATDDFRVPFTGDDPGQVANWKLRIDTDRTVAESG